MPTTTLVAGAVFQSTPLLVHKIGACSSILTSYSVFIPASLANQAVQNVGRVLKGNACTQINMLAGPLSLWVVSPWTGLKVVVWWGPGVVVFVVEGGGGMTPAIWGAGVGGDLDGVLERVLAVVVTSP